MAYIKLSLLLFVAVLVNVQAENNAATNRCPFGLPSTSVMEVYNGRCYQFVGEERYWTGARDYCTQHGGRLVKIDDRNTNDFIVETLNSLWWRNNGVWIGLNDRNMEMRWHWLGMVPYMSEPVRWTNWGSGHPRAFLHTMRDCVRMVRGRGDWLWHETPCQVLNWQYRFICEYEMTATSLVPNTPTTVPSTLVRAFQPHSGWKPDASERRLHSTSIPLSTRPPKKPYQDTNEDDIDAEAVSEKPVHQAVINTMENEQRHAVDSKWYIFVLVVAATVILLLVGLVLWRRRRNHILNLAAKADLESLNFSKSAKLADKNGKGRDTLHGVEPNVYGSSVTMSANSNVYEDVEFKMGNSTQNNEAVLVTSSEELDGYIPMNGNNRYVTGNVIKVSDATDSQLPKYENCPEEISEEEEIAVSDCGMMGYDIPRQANIYSEIPGADSDIYESFDDLKV